MDKTFIEKLIDDAEGRKLYFREDLIFEVAETIWNVMEEKGNSKADLSRLAGVSKSKITQLLSGDHNMRLTTVADLLYALDSKMAVSAVPLDIDSLIESITFNQWAPAVDMTIQQSEYREIKEEEQKELYQAA